MNPFEEQLVAAVSNAGGIGVLGNAIEPAAGTQALIQAIRAATPNLFGVDFIVDTSAFGPTVTDAQAGGIHGSLRSPGI